MRLCDISITRAQLLQDIHVLTAFASQSVVSLRPNKSPCLGTTAGYTFLAITMLFGLLLSAQSKDTELSYTLLLALSSFLLQVPSFPKLNALRRLLAAWLLFGALLPNIDTNLRQSTIVAPLTSLVQLSFDDMVGQNFTFLAFDPQFVQALKGLNDYVLKSSVPKMRGKKIWEFPE